MHASGAMLPLVAVLPLLANVAKVDIRATGWGVEQLVRLAQRACGVFLVMYGLLFTSVS